MGEERIGIQNILESIYQKFYSDYVSWVYQTYPDTFREAYENRVVQDIAYKERFPTFEECIQHENKAEIMSSIVADFNFLYQIDRQRIFASTIDMLNYFLQLATRDKFEKTKRKLIDFLKYFDLQLPVELKFLVIIACIESLHEIEEDETQAHQYFDHWIMRKFIPTFFERIKSFKTLKEFKREFEVLKQEYYRDYGAQRWVRAYFTKYLERPDQITLIKNFQVKKSPYIEGFPDWFWDDTLREYLTRGPITETILPEIAQILNLRVDEGFFPICFDCGQCMVSYGVCQIDQNCRLQTDEGLLNDCLNQISDILYSYRSDFVHLLTNVYLISEQDRNLIGISHIFRDRRTNEIKPIFITLKIEQFNGIIIRSFKNFLENQRTDAGLFQNG